MYGSFISSLRGELYWPLPMIGNFLGKVIFQLGLLSCTESMTSNHSVLISEDLLWALEEKFYRFHFMARVPLVFVNRFYSLTFSTRATTAFSLLNLKIRSMLR
jgi:hypothetical protein